MNQSYRPMMTCLNVQWSCNRLTCTTCQQNLGDGLYFENRVRILDNPLVPFYGRFIDDIFGVVYASSEAEAINIMKVVKFDDCVIEWSMSNSHLTFLDMTIYRDVDNRLQHMPYQKVHSHQERIPWISHHPLDVNFARNFYWGDVTTCHAM